MRKAMKFSALLIITGLAGCANDSAFRTAANATKEEVSALSSDITVFSERESSAQETARIRDQQIAVRTDNADSQRVYYEMKWRIENAQDKAAAFSALEASAAALGNAKPKKSITTEKAKELPLTGAPYVAIAKSLAALSEEEDRKDAAKKLLKFGKDVSDRLKELEKTAP